MTDDSANFLFHKIAPFAEYGFNKSHAAAYAIIAYQTAYLKTHFPNEFFAASMTMDLSNQNKLGEFYEELKRLNIKIICILCHPVKLCNSGLTKAKINKLFSTSYILHFIYFCRINYNYIM